MPVPAVRVRDVKSHPSEPLRPVRRGEVVLVTDRRGVVAERRARFALRDVPDRCGSPGTLAAKRVATLGLPHEGVKVPPTGVGAPPGTVRALLDGERGILGNDGFESAVAGVAEPGAGLGVGELAKWTP